jgi:hypothetical protein
VRIAAPLRNRFFYTFKEMTEFPVFCRPSALRFEVSPKLASSFISFYGVVFATNNYAGTPSDKGLFRLSTKMFWFLQFLTLKIGDC